MRLLCLPHAGAGASVYRSWGKNLSPDVTVCPVQPPGRERRSGERPFSSVEPLAKQIAQEIASSVASPYAIFGHSTGALCAFQVIRELRASGKQLPVHLFVAGRRAPQLKITRTDLAGLSPSELSALLRRLGGTPEEVLADYDLLANMQPLLAADFAVNECYTYKPGPPLNIPITAFTGKADASADVTQMAGWCEQTTNDFCLHAFSGGHFAVFDHTPEVHALIIAALQDQG